MGEKRKNILGAQTVGEEAAQQKRDHERYQRERIDDLERQVGAVQEERARLEVEYNQLRKQVQAVEGITARTYKPSVIEPRKGKSQGEAIAVLQCGDWHPYERVRPEQVNGLNEFTPNLCKQSVKNLARGFVRLLEIERAGQNIYDCVVAIHGDIIGNMIHLEKVETNAGTPQEEELFVIFDLLIPMLEYLLKHGNFRKIYVKCNHGNHDRGTDKPQYENMALHSHAWVVYHVVKRWFENTKWADKIEFDVATGYHLYYNLYGRTVRQHHGDAFKYNGGVGGPTISVKRGIAQWEQGKSLYEVEGELPGHADFDMFGHLHCTFGDNTFSACPSLIGYSPFSLAHKLPYEPPAQRFLLIDKKRWITSDRRIYVR